MARKENYEPTPFKPVVDLGTILVDLLNTKQNGNNSSASTASSGSLKTGNQSQKSSSELSDDNPTKALNSVIIAAIAPLVAQHAAEAYMQTGQIPDASALVPPQEQSEVAPQNSQTASAPRNINQNELLKQAGVNQGLLSTLLGRNLNPEYTDAQLKNISDAQKITGQEPVQEKDRLLAEYRKSEEQYRQKEIELKDLQIQQLKSGNQPMNPEELFAQSNIPPNEQEDYLIKPVKQTIRGILTTVPIVERKKSLPAKNLDDLANLDNSRQDLNQVVERLKKNGLQLGPGFSTTPGAISDMLGQMKGAEFAGIKADIGRNFQLYRKWATGVAAGYPELNMLAPNYPKATDTNEVFIQKSIDVIKDIERNRNIMLDHFSNGGYAVSKLRNMDSSSTVQSVPKVGETFNGAKVLKVRRIK